MADEPPKKGAKIINLWQRMTETRDKAAPPRAPNVAFNRDYLARLLEISHYDDATNALRPMEANERGDLFDALITLRVLPSANPSPESSRRKRGVGFLAHLETPYDLLLMVACHVGFAVDAARAERVLGLLAADAAPFKLGEAIASTWQRFGILPDIARAVSAGMPLSPAARVSARRLLEMYRAKTDLQEIAAADRFGQMLLTLAGEAEGNDFFSRMRRLPPPRAVDVGAYLPMLDGLAPVIAEAKTLLAEIRAQYDNPTLPASWLNDAGLYRQRFGGWGDGKTVLATFGWWRGDSETRRGRRIDDADFVRQRNDWVAAETLDVATLRDAIGRGGDGMPQVFSREAVPDLDAFSFEGADPDGQLLNRLVTLDGPRPDAVWLAECSRQIGRIGGDRVVTGLSRWLSHLDPANAERIDWLAAGRCSRLATFWRNNLKSMFRSHGLDEQTGRSVLAKDRQMLSQAALHFVNDCWVLFASGDTWDSRLIAAAKEQADKAMQAGISDNNATILHGIAWALTHVEHPDRVALLEFIGRHAAVSRQRKARSEPAALAAVEALGRIGGRDSLFALARLRQLAAGRVLRAKIDGLLVSLAGQAGLTDDDIDELTLPDAGLGGDGRRSVTEGSAIVTLRITGGGDIAFSYRSARVADHPDVDGIPEPGLPRALVAARHEIARQLPVIARRLELSWRQGRSWSLADWRQRYLDNPLAATVARRLVWRLESADGETMDVLPAEGGVLLGPDGAAVAADAAVTVRLWHPMVDSTSGIAAWRRLMRDHGIRQPFPQAWRPVYDLPEAQRALGPWSTRFAGHMLHRPRLVAILSGWGWVADGDGRLRLPLPAYGIVAEYPLQEAADGVTTGSVAFLALPATPLATPQVPPLALSEVLLDLDRAIAASTVAADRFWTAQDTASAHSLSQYPGAADYRRHFDERDQGALLAMRREVLATVLPELPFARQCQLTERELVVHGPAGDCAIHLVHGGIRALSAQTAPDVSAVPDERSLPFVGDEKLPIILGKARRLAEGN